MLIGTSLDSLGQGWEETYDFPSNRLTHDVMETNDNGFLILSQTTETSFTSIKLIKINSEGQYQWDHTVTGIQAHVVPKKFIKLADGSYIIGAFISNSSEPFEEQFPFALKLDANFNLIWQYTYNEMPNALDYSYPYFTDIAQCEDGGFIFIGEKTVAVSNPNDFETYVFSQKLDADGNPLWSETLNDADKIFIEKTSDNNFVISYSDFGGDIHLKKIDQNGTSIWEHIHNIPFDAYALPPGTPSFQSSTVIIEADDQSLDVFLLVFFDEVINPKAFIVNISQDGSALLDASFYDFWNLDEVKKTNDGGYILLGMNRDSENISRTALLKIDSDKNQAWTKLYENMTIHGNVIQSQDAGFLICGSVTEQADYFPHLIKTNNNGDVNSYYISGNIFQDFDLNCNKDSGEIGLNDWIIMAEDGTNIFYTTSNLVGNYTFPLDSGTYNVQVIYPAPYWTTCSNPIEVNLTQIYDTTFANFPLSPSIECPHLTIDMGTPFLRWCNTNYYVIDYCNFGSAPSSNTTIQLSLDPFLTLLDSEIPFSQSDPASNSYLFEIGDLGINECNSFVVDIELSCDLEMQGDIHCSSVKIEAEEDCQAVSANWDGSDIIVNGICDNDSVNFTLSNIGEDMAESRSYFVIEDQIMMLQGDYELDAGEDTTLTFAANEFIYYLEAQQAENHPESEKSSAVVEGCGNNINISGLLNLYPMNDDEPNLDIDCTNNINSYDPNDKQGSPLGYGEENFISPGTDIEYRIRFQNTGTDTAFTVILKDTLSELLEIASIQPGASSHNYDFSFSDQNVIYFTFENILLVDSNTNEALSHGFVNFKIAHKKGIGPGSEIHNQAGIYFDANPVVMTNRTLHTIQTNYLEVILDSQTQSDKKILMKVYPNPATDFAKFVFSETISDGQFSLFSVNGQLAKAFQFKGSDFKLQANNFQPGIYFFEVISKGARIQSGKLIIR